MHGRTMVVIALIVAFLLFPIEGSRAQSTGLSGGIFFAPNSVRSVTLSKGGAVVASFSIPKGTYLSASYDDKQPHSITPGRWEFHGDIAVRVQPASAMQQRQPGQTVEQVMNQAPVVLTGQGMDVVVENVR